MPKIHPHPDHQQYAALKAEIKEFGDTNMCTVLAAAVLTRLSYETCFNAFEQAGRIRGKGANITMQRAAFELLGYKMVEYDLAQIKKRYKGAHANLKNFTTYHPIRFAYAWSGTPDLYIQGNTHAAAYKNERVVDWSNDRKTRITTAHRIVKIDAPQPFNITPPTLTMGAGILEIDL